MEYKERYNEVIGRIKRAEEYFKRTDITEQEKSHYIPECNSLMSEANRLLSLIGRYSPDDILNGFRLCNTTTLKE
jgi:hypothetical protein